MFENYQDAIAYLYKQLPMYQRVGSAAYKKDLNNTLALLNYLHKPHLKLKTIHIAGTNGKGSVSHMLASVFQEAGFTTGLYTSPHLIDFTERIKIDGVAIGKNEVLEFVNLVQPAIATIQPSFFELTVAMAFYHFEKAKVDYAVIETGLGGRLDSTNVIKPILSVITNIGFDHTEMLGDTLAKIATEKAGIIKSDTPVIIGYSQPDTIPVFQQTANEKRAQIRFADQVYKAILVQQSIDNQTLAVSKYDKFIMNVNLPLAGTYQIQNTVTVFAAIEELNNIGFDISEATLSNGLLNVKQNTGFKGRWEVLNKNPLAIADTGHNVEGLAQVINQIKSVNKGELHIVLAVVADKDITAMLQLMPLDAKYYFSAAQIPRALSATKLKEFANQFGLVGDTYETIRIAYDTAISKAKLVDTVFVGGSTFTVAEVL